MQGAAYSSPMALALASSLPVRACPLSLLPFWGVLYGQLPNARSCPLAHIFCLCRISCSCFSFFSCRHLLLLLLSSPFLSRVSAHLATGRSRAVVLLLSCCVPANSAWSLSSLFFLSHPALSSFPRIHFVSICIFIPACCSFASLFRALTCSLFRPFGHTPPDPGLDTLLLIPQVPSCFVRPILNHASSIRRSA